MIPGGTNARYIVSTDSRLEGILGKRPSINAKRFTIITPNEGYKLAARRRLKALQISPIRWRGNEFILEIKETKTYIEHSSDKTSNTIVELTEHTWTYHYEYSCQEDGFKPSGIQWDGKYVMGLVE